jgi:hypothetical protein
MFAYQQMETAMMPGKHNENSLALAIAAAIAIETEERILIEDYIIDNIFDLIFFGIDTDGVRAA